MSKYNNMKSIPISSLSEQELKIAMKEWAEGSDSMEKLLWACRLRGIETTGCHAGANPYLAFCVNNSKAEIAKLLNAAQQIKGSQVFITPDGGNPFSGPDWYKSGIAVGFNAKYKEEGSAIFDKLSEALMSEDVEHSTDDEIFTPILDLLEFFDGKDSQLMFRAMHTQDDKYKFVAETWFRNRDFSYFNSLFQNAGLQLEDVPEDDPVKVWSTTDSDPQKLAEKIKESKESIISDYSLEPETEVVDGMSFNQVARIKKREFGDTIEGQKKMNEWIEKKRAERDKMWEALKNKSTYSKKGIMASGLQMATSMLKKASKIIKSIFKGKENVNER